jgi:hypothetical protein
MEAHQQILATLRKGERGDAGRESYFRGVTGCLGRGLSVKSIIEPRELLENKEEKGQRRGKERREREAPCQHEGM